MTTLRKAILSILTLLVLCIPASQAQAANRFWVGGTGTWDASDTSHWSATDGGSSGASVPGVNDAVIINANSGAGTITVNTTVTVQSITCGAMGMTLDFSANNNNVTLTASAAFSGSGTGTRTINLGNGLWTLTGSGTVWNMATTTGLTFNANSSTISLTGNTPIGSTRSFSGGGLTYSTVTFSGAAAGGATAIGQANTFSTLTITGPNYVTISAATQTVTNLNLNGTSTGQVYLGATNANSQNTVTVTTLSATWAAFRGILGSGSATNSFDLGGNTGITITPPATSGGGRIIGG